LDKFVGLQTRDLEKGAAQSGLRRTERLGELAERQAFFGGLREKACGALNQRDRAGDFVGSASRDDSRGVPLPRASGRR